MSKPKSVNIIEVGMRDGLQIEPGLVPASTKVELMDGLIQAGIKHIEATSFVSPRAVPQLADAAQVLANIGRSEEHTSELQSLMRISYAVFCLKRKKTIQQHKYRHNIIHA